MMAEMKWISTPAISPDHEGPINRSFRPMPGPEQMMPLVAMLNSVACEQPDAPAIEDGDRRILSFAGLISHALRLAARLRTLPAGPVGVRTSGDSDAAAVFGCLAAERMMIQMDAAAPDARNTELLRMTNAVAVVGSLRTTAALGIPYLGVDDGPSDPVTMSLEPYTGSLDAGAFIMPTSGSTGRPKLIVHSQRTMFHWVRTLNNAMHLDGSDRVLSLSSSSTLGGFTALLSFPLSGGCLQMLDLKRAGISGLTETLRQRPVTILRATPSTLRGLARLPGATETFAGLRLVQAYGEPLMAEDVMALRQVLSMRALIRTTYGSTECSGLSWYAKVDMPEARLPTGVLMPDTQALILDEAGEPLPPGQKGELLIRSPYNALGEWENGELTTGRLQPDPQDPSWRIYHTGDLASVDAHGVFTVLGRRDRMIKINGQRLEPAEIERLLRGSPHVERAEVVVDISADPNRLLAFIVPASDAPSGLRDQLTCKLDTELPGYMLPSRLVLVKTIPLLSSGKVDAAALIASLTPPAAVSR